ncbi:MAG: peptidoglycan binding domain-containing protein, partial [Anaerolineae bacterium]|nr:peptidoglycan binding domain-containing protein [Anaerolineae bacterium]
MINQISQVVNLPSFKKVFTLLFTFLFLIAGGLLAAIIFAVLGFQIFYLDRAYPGVTVNGIDVTGLTQPEIVDIVAQQADDILQESITIQVGDETHTFTKKDLGIYVDIEATADKAYHIGRQGNLLVDVPMHLSLLSRTRDVQPVVLYDTGPSHQMLQSLIEVSDYPPQKAELVIHSVDKVEIVPASFGQRLHVDATRPLIETALFSDNTEPVQAVTQKIQPALSNEDVAPVYRQVTNLLAKPLTFSAKSGSDPVEWRIEPKTLLSMFDLVEWVDDNGKLQLKMELKQDEFTPYYEEFAQRIDQESADAELRFDTEANKLVVLKESKDGRHLDTDA